MRLHVKKRKKFVIKLIILSIIVCCAYFFINQRVKIKIKSDELGNINKQIEVEKQKNEEIREKINRASNESEKDNSHKRVFENVAE